MTNTSNPTLSAYVWSGPEAEGDKGNTHGFVPLQNALSHPRDQALYGEFPYELGG